MLWDTVPQRCFYVRIHTRAMRRGGTPLRCPTVAARDPKPCSGRPPPDVVTHKRVEPNNKPSFKCTLVSVEFIEDIDIYSLYTKDLPNVRNRGENIQVIISPAPLPVSSLWSGPRRLLCSGCPLTVRSGESTEGLCLPSVLKDLSVVFFFFSESKLVELSFKLQIRNNNSFKGF